MGVIRHQNYRELKNKNKFKNKIITQTTFSKIPLGDDELVIERNVSGGGVLTSLITSTTTGTDIYSSVSKIEVWIDGVRKIWTSPNTKSFDMVFVHRAFISQRDSAYTYIPIPSVGGGTVEHDSIRTLGKYCVTTGVKLLVFSLKDNLEIPSGINFATVWALWDNELEFKESFKIVIKGMRHITLNMGYMEYNALK